jgi:hypothetical protein
MSAKQKQKPGRTNDEHRFKRTLRFEVRLSPIEYEALALRWGDSGSNSLARYVRACIFGSEDMVALYWQQRGQDRLGRLQVLAELGRIGSNVNQIARQLNRYDGKSAATLAGQLQEVRAELARIAIAASGTDSEGQS